MSNEANNANTSIETLVQTSSSQVIDVIMNTGVKQVTEARLGRVFDESADDDSEYWAMTSTVIAEVLDAIKATLTAPLN